MTRNQHSTRQARNQLYLNNFKVKVSRTTVIFKQMIFSSWECKEQLLKSMSRNTMREQTLIHHPPQVVASHSGNLNLLLFRAFNSQIWFTSKFKSQSHHHRSTLLVDLQLLQHQFHQLDHHLFHHSPSIMELYKMLRKNVDQQWFFIKRMMMVTLMIAV